MVDESNDVEPIASALTPNLGAVRRFIVDMVERGSIAMLVSAVLGLLRRMDALNRELQRKLEQSRRKRPPAETMDRLQMELPFLTKKADNDTATAAKPAPKEKKKRGPRTPHPHGRPTFAEHLPRVAALHRVPDAERTCPHCDIECSPIGGGHVISNVDLLLSRCRVATIVFWNTTGSAKQVFTPSRDECSRERPIRSVGEHVPAMLARRRADARVARLAENRRALCSACSNGPPSLEPVP